jgi:excisionase family DNA binding protein
MMGMDGQSRLLRPREVAERLGISERTLRRLMVEGLPAIRVAPRSPRFDPAEVTRWLASRSTTGKAA